MNVKLGHILIDLLMADAKSVDLILKNPLNLLYDSFFELVQGASHKGIYYLMNSIHKTKSDPT